MKKSFNQRLFWLLVCTTLGLGIGLLGYALTSNPKWFLAMPAMLAAGWLYFANPASCQPGSGDSYKKWPGLMVYCARAGDHNDRAMAGALAIGKALSRRLGIPATTIGEPETALKTNWEKELAEARPTLLELSKYLEISFKRGHPPLLALSRCAAALGTLPVLVRHRPDACVVWIDAHGDLNTPHTSLSGYLGGMALAGPAGLWDSGLGNGLLLANIILVGARDLDPAEQALVDAGKVSLIPRGSDTGLQLRNALAGRPAYIHLDCDVLEPGIVPTDYRVPGGFSLAEIHGLCRTLAETEIVGIEIAEFENAWSENNAPVSPEPLLEALAPAIDRLGAHPGNGA